MSFLLDPPWLYANGEAYARLAPEEAQGRTAAALGAATIAVFWITSVSLYLNRPWTGWIWRLCRAEDGRDWMLNSGVFSFDHRRAGPATHAVAAALFATYPAWLWLGWRRGRRSLRPEWGHGSLRGARRRPGRLLRGALGRLPAARQALAPRPRRRR